VSYAEWIASAQPGQTVPDEYAAEHRRAYLDWRASFPHDPMWNLIPLASAHPWNCEWHGTQERKTCPECRREHAEYLATGTWEDRR
jgi:hypothetical protein